MPTKVIYNIIILAIVWVGIVGAGVYVTMMKQPERLAEFVRKRLARVITEKYSTEDGRLPLASLNPSLERDLGNALQQTDEGSYLALEPGSAQKLINVLNNAANKFIEQGMTPLILAPNHIRSALARFVERFAPGYSVISHQEIAPNVRVQSLGVIGLDEVAG